MFPSLHPVLDFAASCATLVAGVFACGVLFMLPNALCPMGGPAVARHYRERRMAREAEEKQARRDRKARRESR